MSVHRPSVLVAALACSLLALLWFLLETDLNAPPLTSVVNSPVTPHE